MRAKCRVIKTNAAFMAEIRESTLADAMIHSKDSNEMIGTAETTEWRKRSVHELSNRAIRGVICDV